MGVFVFFRSSENVGFAWLEYGGWLAERLDGTWRRIGGKEPSAWTKTGWRMVGNGTKKGVIAGEEGVFHALFHEESGECE